VATVTSSIAQAAGTITVSANAYNGVTAGSIANTWSTPQQNGSVILRDYNGNTAEINVALINDLKTLINEFNVLLEVINDMPDDHLLSDLKKDMHVKKALKRLGS
jgi:hypothetical protein